MPASKTRKATKPRSPRPKPEQVHDLKTRFDRLENSGPNPETTRFSQGKGRGTFLNWFEGTGTKTVDNALSVVKRLRRAGVFVPKVKKVDRTNQIAEFEKEGTALVHLISKSLGKRKALSPQQLQHFAPFLAKAARALGRTHAAGVQHMHPHFGNIVVKGNKVGLIDFKRAKIVEVPWTHPSTIYNAFEFDLFWIHRVFEKYSREQNRPFFQAQKKRFFEIMVKNYPCKPEVKKALLEIIFKQFKIK